MVIERIDKMIHLCEMKFRDRKFAIDKSYADIINRRADIFKEKTQTTCQVVNTIVTPVGLTNSKYNALIHSVVTADELFSK